MFLRADFVMFLSKMCGPIVTVNAERFQQDVASSVKTATSTITAPPTGHVRH